MDLLRLLADDIGFNFDLFQVEDKLWGAYNVNENFCKFIKNHLLIVFGDKKLDWFQQGLILICEVRSD
jgi:hypothetical protein